MPEHDAPDRFAVVDLETSGLHPESDSILQFAVVTVDRIGNLLDECHSYVRPPCVLTAELGPKHVHGISRLKLITAPNTQSSLRRLAEATRGAIVVAHNAKFDTSFIRTAARAHEVALEWQGVLCTLKLSRRLDPSRERLHKLSDVCARYGVENPQAHHALFDARATATLLPLLLDDLDAHDFASVSRYFVS